LCLDDQNPLLYNTLFHNFLSNKIIRLDTSHIKLRYYHIHVHQHFANNLNQHVSVVYRLLKIQEDVLNVNSYLSQDMYVKYYLYLEESQVDIKQHVILFLSSSQPFNYITIQSF